MRLRKALRKIHRWTGLLASVWLLQLAVTGMLLQFAGPWGLSDTYVKSPKILQWFDYGKHIQVFESGHRSIYQIDDVLAINGKKHQVSGKVISAVMIQDQWLVATESSLSVYLQNGDLLNQWDDFDGLPTPVNTLGSHDDAIFIQSQSQWFELNQGGEFEAVENLKIESTYTSRTQLNSMEKQLIFEDVLSEKLSYDKVIHGIHSAMKGSVWLNTLSALALIYLCVSGIYLFFKAPNKKTNK